MKPEFTPELAHALATMTDRAKAMIKDRNARHQKCTVGRQYPSPYREQSLYGNENLGVAHEILNRQP